MAFRLSLCLMSILLQLARERMNMTPGEEIPTVRDANSFASAALSASTNEASTPSTNNLSVSAQDVVVTVSSPVSVTPAATPELAVTSEISSIQEAVTSGLSSTQEDTANATSDDTGLHTPEEVAASVVVSDTPAPTATPTAATSPMYQLFPFDYVYLVLSWVIMMDYFQYYFRGVPDISPQEAAPTSAKTCDGIAEVTLWLLLSVGYHFLLFYSRSRCFS